MQEMQTQFRPTFGVIEAAFLRDWRFICVDGSPSGWQSGGYAIAGALIYGTTL